MSVLGKCHEAKYACGDWSFWPGNARLFHSHVERVMRVQNAGQNTYFAIRCLLKSIRVSLLSI